MANVDLKLLGTRSSPFVLRVQIALKIKCMEYDFIEQRLIAKSELLLKSNPVYKKVPVLLLQDGNSICESLVILQYLDEVSKGNPVLPSDPYERANARFWSAYIDDKFFPALLHISVVKGEEAKKAKIEQVKEGITLLEDAFVKGSSKDKDFFGGENIGFVDIVFGSFLQWLEVIEKINGLDPFIDEFNTPNLFNWAKKFCSHTCVKDLIPDVDKLGEFAKLLFAKLREDAQKLSP